MKSHPIKRLLSTKIGYLGLGMANILIFHYSIWRIYFFLYDASNRPGPRSKVIALLIDLGLLLVFCVPHSLLLASRVKIKLLDYFPNALYSSFYSIHAGLSIILMDRYWVNFGGDFYHVSGPFSVLFQFLYITSWVFMFWTMLATGLFRQSGIEQWWKGLNNQNISYTLIKEGPYKFCRHPIYAAFLAMIWATPNMTTDRLFLALSWTSYILIGALLKEKRLRKNKKYIEYAKLVPAFPFLPKYVDHFLTNHSRRF